MTRVPNGLKLFAEMCQKLRSRSNPSDLSKFRGCRHRSMASENSNDSRTSEHKRLEMKHSCMIEFILMINHEPGLDAELSFVILASEKVSVQRIHMHPR